jgi:cytochrome P450 family 307 subfamily A
MNDVGCEVLKNAMNMMKSTIKPEGENIYLKPLVQSISANLFTLYMSSKKFDYDDAGFRSIVRCFDEVFWEINQGYAVDFLPWLSPFYSSHFKTLDSWANDIRTFITNELINPRYEQMRKNPDDVPEDFLSTLLSFLETEENVTENTIIYMMEDFIGGHSAIGELKFFFHK